MKATKPTPAMLFAVLAATAIGRANAVNAKLLAERLNLDYGESGYFGNGGGANLRKLVNDAISAGFPVCSYSKGYFVPETAEDVAIGASEIRQRCRALMERLAKLDQNCIAHLARHGRPTGA